MSPAEKISRMVKKLHVGASEELDERVHDSLSRSLAEYENTQPAANEQPNIWRIIMKNRMVKLAAAAAIIVAVYLGALQFGVQVDSSNVAWGQIVSRISDVDYLHFYQVETPKRENSLPMIREGWYANGKMRTISGGYGGYQSFDDGKTWRLFDRHNNMTGLGKSFLARHSNIFEEFTDGVLPFDISQYRDQNPVSVGSDFLIYDFVPEGEESEWIEKISVTVGRNSLMPIQIKTYYKTQVWFSASNLILFDYEEPPKPEDFFSPPSETKPPHATAQLVLGGDEVEIEVHDSAGIKKAIVRLHTKFDGPAEEVSPPYRERYTLTGQPMYFMEITFVIDEGYRSNTASNCPLWLDQGTKAALGNQDTWPDRKYRNISYTPVLRATDKEDVFTLELSCWLRTREPDL